jgi:hypothetical protein
MNSIIRDLTPKTNKPYLTKTYLNFFCCLKLYFMINYLLYKFTPVMRFSWKKGGDMHYVNR